LQQDTYTIVPSDEGWTLHLNGRELADFAEEQHAFQAASVAARMSERRGKAVEIEVRDCGASA
jgi:hypothetical protein